MQRTFENFAEWAITENGTAEETAARQLEMFVDLLQQQAGGPLGYRLRRIILTNFWLYGQQEFEIPHGRLFLAGENASGKSTVLMAALPLAPPRRRAGHLHAGRPLQPAGGHGRPLRGAARPGGHPSGSRWLSYRVRPAGKQSQCPGRCKLRAVSHRPPETRKHMLGNLGGRMTGSHRRSR